MILQAEPSGIGRTDLANLWSTSDPNDNSARTVWLRYSRQTFDVAALLL